MSAMEFDTTAKPTGPQFADMTGQRFGRLIVSAFAGVRKGTKYWSTKCDCGGEKVAAASNLTTGKTTSCGCAQREAMHKRLKDLTGQRFGRLVITGFAEMRGAWSWWNALCDCGRRTTVKSGALNIGDVRSCGCLAAERAAELAKSNITHGASYTAEYSIWRGMKDRCGNPNAPKYNLYGGRGIVVCERWAQSFETFLAYMGKRPSPKHSIDRYPNGDGNYEPGNVRWATPSEQNSNRRTYTRRQKITREERSGNH
jgi:hypothetical protein